MITISPHVGELLKEFESIKASERDFFAQLRLKQIADQLIKLSSQEVIPYLITYLKEKKYLYNKTETSAQLTYVLKILAEYKDSQSVDELINLSKSNLTKNYFKDICEIIGKIKTEKSRHFLKANLMNNKVGVLCARALSHFPDSSGEAVLLSHFKQGLDEKKFSSDTFFALISIQNNKIWDMIDHYLMQNINEKERYKIALNLLNVNNSRIIPLLITCYRHYSINKSIHYNDVKDISLEGKKLFLTKVFKESIPFSHKMTTKIINKLYQYHSNLRVKTLLRNIEYQNQ